MAPEYISLFSLTAIEYLAYFELKEKFTLCDFLPSLLAIEDFSSLKKF